MFLNMLYKEIIFQVLCLCLSGDKLTGAKTVQVELNLAYDNDLFETQLSQISGQL
jgi:hypothetical protein